MIADAQITFLPVSDLVRSRAFYEGVLGLHLVVVPPDLLEDRLLVHYPPGVTGQELQQIELADRKLNAAAAPLYFAAGQPDD